MCGILGFVRSRGTTGLVDGDLAALFTDGMLVGSVRGMDSFGYMYVSSEFQGYKKFPMAAPLLYDSPYFEDMKARARNSQVMVGHHRAKTTGVISEAAAHPYCVVSDDTKRVVRGVHNGSLTSWSSQTSGKHFATDSEWLFWKIANEGPEALKTINGAYAVVFTMSDHPGKLFFARNNDRPLAYARSPDKKVLLFCSEYPMLDWLASRTPYSIKLDDTLAKGRTCWADVDPFNLYTVDINDPGNLTQEECLRPPPPKAVSSSYAGGTVYQGGYNYNRDAPTLTSADYDKKKYPTCEIHEIIAAYDWDVINKEVTGLITGGKKDKKGRIRFVSGYITSDDDGIEDLPFRMRDIGEEWQEVLEDFESENIYMRFKIGGVQTDKKNSDPIMLVGKLDYVYTEGQAAMLSLAVN